MDRILFCVQDQFVWKPTEKNSQVLESARQSGRGRIGSAGGNVFLENVRQDRATVLTLMANGYARVPTKAGCERPGSTSLPRVCAYVCVRELMCARIPHYSFEQWTRVGTTSRCTKRKRGERVCRADMFRYVALGDRDNARAKQELLNSRRISVQRVIRMPVFVDARKRRYSRHQELTPEKCFDKLSSRG